jgi:hypothetical protein
MRDPNKSKVSGKDAFTRGSEFLAYVIGVLLTVLTGPLLYDLNKGWFLRYADARFGAGWHTFFNLLLIAFCGLGTLGLSLMVVSMTIRIGAAKFAGWFFGD